MAVTTAFCNSAKVELFEGVHNFGTDTFKVALIQVDESGTYGAGTESYSDLTGNSDEAAVAGAGGSGYTAGGPTLTLDSSSPVLSDTTAIVDFEDTVFTLATSDETPSLAANGCIIYNDDASGDPAVSVHAFSGGPEASGAGATFTIQYPTADASNAILRLA